MPVGGENPQPAAERQAEQRAEFQQRIQELDSPCYETRRTGRRAAGTLAGHARNGGHAGRAVPAAHRAAGVAVSKSAGGSRSGGPDCRRPRASRRKRCPRKNSSVWFASWTTIPIRFAPALANACSGWPRSEHLAKPIMLILKRRLADPVALRGHLSPPGIDPQHCLGHLAHQRCCRLESAAGFPCADRRLAR